MAPAAPKRSLTRATIIASVVGATFFAPHAPAFAAKTAVAIEDFSYQAPEVTVRVGDTVTWTNKDTAEHDVQTSKAPVKFASPLMKQGETFSIKFTKRGVYEYFCNPHPHMVAKIIVK